MNGLVVIGSGRLSEHSVNREKRDKEKRESNRFSHGDSDRN
jgi:hypothetical protein